MASKTFTLNNPGTIPVTIQSINFRDPPNISHVADLTNLGGSASVTGNATLSYVLGVGASQTFAIDYINTTAAAGTYEGRVMIAGSDRASTVITSTIVVSAAAITTTTAPPLPSPSAGCVIEGSRLVGLNTQIASGVASITGSTSGSSVWGDNSYGYTTDSDFAKAAVHAGILSDGQTGNVQFTNLGSKPGPFPGTTANGVTTSPWSTSWCTVLLSTAAGS